MLRPSMRIAPVAGWEPMVSGSRAIVALRMDRTSELPPVVASSRRRRDEALCLSAIWLERAALLVAASHKLSRYCKLAPAIPADG